MAWSAAMLERLPLCGHVFAPIRFARGAFLCYSNLKTTKLTPEQKAFFARQCDDDFENDGGINLKGELSALQFGTRYGLRKGTVSKWRSRNRKGLTLNPKKGRPPAIDEQGLAKLFQLLKKGKPDAPGAKKRKGLALYTVDEAKELMENVKKESSERQHGVLLKVVDSDDEEDDRCDDPRPMDYRTFKKHKKRKLVDTGTGEVTRWNSGKGQVNTYARADALADNRLALKMGVVLLATASETPNQIFWNNDGSTMISQSDGSGAEMVRIVSSKNTKAIEGALQSTTFQQELGICLKWEQLATADGCMGRVCICVAIPNMPEGQFYRKDVKGLTNTTDLGAIGTIYVAKTRCMRPDPSSPPEVVTAWQDYMQHVLIPDVSSLADKLDLRDETGTRYDSVVTIDGEAVILNNLLGTTLQALLDAKLISVIKVVPSGTARHNGCDAGDVFRDKNAGLKYLEKHPSVDYTNAQLNHELGVFWDDLKKQYPDVDISAAYIKKVNQGIQKFVWVTKNKGFVTPQKIQEGFVRAGQKFKTGEVSARPVPGFETSLRDFHKIVTALCTTPLLPGELDTIYDHVPAMVASVKTRGRLEDEVLDGMGVLMRPAGELKQRDALTLCQQGPTVITHEETVARYLAWKGRKDRLPKGPPKTDEEKELAKLEKKLAAQLAAQLKKAAGQGEARQKKEAEKARRDALGAQGRKAEDQVKKQAKEAADSAKMAANKARLLELRALLQIGPQEIDDEEEQGEVGQEDEEEQQLDEDEDN